MRTTIVIALALVLAACGCRDRPDGSAPAAARARGEAAPRAEGCRLVESGRGPKGTVPLSVETVVDGLEVPWALAFLPDGDLLLTERPGRIRRVHEGRLLPTPLATVPVAPSDEGGLLGLALHPDFPSNRRFFLYYTGESEDGRAVNRVERWRLAPDGRTAAFEARLLDGIPAARWHDGGRIRVGPDRKLYVATGDATEPSSAQDLGSLAGKLLRLDLDGGVPDDNPFPGSPVWLYGIRNLEAFDWRDPATLVLAEHGPSGEQGRTGHDEVNVARKGANLGWPHVHGCRPRAGATPPALTWTQAVPPGGGTWFTGAAIPAFRESFVFAALGARHLHRVVFDPERPDRVRHHEVYLEGAHGRLREVVQGPDGALYVTTSNCDGRARCPSGKDRILRITEG